MDCRRRSEDTSYTGRAIYLHVIEDLDAQRLYVGQALNLHRRIEEHMSFRSRRDTPSLHYYALQRSQRDYYVTLSYVPDANSCQLLGIQHSNLFLDLLETWCCLMFCTLSKKYLEEFLPKDIQIPKKTYENLNLKLPLQESGSNWYEIRDILLESPDSLCQDYYFDRVLKHHHKTPELIEYRKLGLEICKKLDRITIPGSTPSRPTWPSPPASAFKPAERRLQPEAAKQIRPSTPSSTKLGAMTNLLMDDVSLDSGPACVEASNLDKSEQEKRMREFLEETPSGSRPAKMICTNNDSLTVHPINRILDFKNIAEPKENRHGSDPYFFDLNDLSDGDWGLDQDIS
jgi:hypothetical protein